MAKAIFYTKNRLRIKPEEKSYPVTSVDFEKQNVRVFEKLNILKSIRNKYYPITKIINKPINVKVEDTLPFRIKFINIGIDGYGPNNPPPIGIAVIGYSNYIL